ncbi:MAG: aspartate decarboxylase [Verrucomicrobia bacterium]|nr:aspartate decarboxylase [Verrucomicrobiota bacterium]
MTPALRPFLRAAIPGIRLTSIHREGAAIEEGAVLLGPRVCWAAGLHEFEHIEITNVTRGFRFSGHVRYGREGEVAITQPARSILMVGDVLKVAAYAWLADGAIEGHVTYLVKVDAANTLIEFRQVPARGVSLDPASFPPPPAIEVVALG